MQTLVQMIYPSQCVLCPTLVESDLSLCGPCWRDTHFITGTRCMACGLPLPGEEAEGLRCDDCLHIARPWRRGAAAVLYSGNGRRVALGLKHGDRTDYAIPAARWMLAALPEPEKQRLIVPVPLHRWRFLKRRYNQAGLLAQELSRLTGWAYLPDALLRPQATAPLDGVSRDQRFCAMQGAITSNPKQSAAVAGQPILLVDDVMTSGATLAAAADALLQAGADHIDVLVLARVAKDA